MTDEGQRIKIMIVNKIATLQSILDEEHVNVLNGNVSYGAWRSTNARLLQHYRRFVRSAYRLYNSNDIDGQEGLAFIQYCKSEKYLAKSRTDVVRRIMQKRIEVK